MEQETIAGSNLLLIFCFSCYFWDKDNSKFKRNFEEICNQLIWDDKRQLSKRAKQYLKDYFLGPYENTNNYMEKPQCQ